MWRLIRYVAVQRPHAVIPGRAFFRREPGIQSCHALCLYKRDSGFAAIGRAWRGPISGAPE
jgi:hypothetical protein